MDRSAPRPTIPEQRDGRSRNVNYGSPTSRNSTRVKRIEFAASSCGDCAFVPALPLPLRGLTRPAHRISRCCFFRLDELTQLSGRRKLRSHAIGDALRLDCRLPCSKRAVSILQMWCTLYLCMSMSTALNSTMGSRRVIWPRKQRRQKRRPVRRKRSKASPYLC
jgi:hypothetical protein